MVEINYKPAPTAARFHADKTSKVKGLLGPVGGGKTVALVMEMLMIAMEQQADEQEFFYKRKAGRAVRPTRFAAVRATYPQLRSTLIKTFDEWPGKLGTIVYDSPIRFRAEVPLPDGTLVDFEVLFIALDGPRAGENLRSMEITGLAISEYAEIDLAVMEMGMSRIGRYPKTKRAVDGDESSPILFGPTRTQIIMESNPPSSRSHWYKLFEVDRPRGVRLYKQPPAMLWNYELEKWVPNPEAENIANLPGGFQYYENIVATNSREYCNVYVANQYGAVFAGQPVFSAFSHIAHVAGYSDPEQADAMRPSSPTLLVGMDFGLHPAAVIVEPTPTGAMLVFDEVVFDESVGFEEFLDEGLLPLLRTRYAGKGVQVVGDPAGVQRSALSSMTALDMLRERGLAAEVAHTNAISLRLEAVNHFLRMRGGFLVHPRCTTLVEALAGGYRFAERQHGVADTPEKNEYSHVADALQYAALSLHKGVLVGRRRQRRAARAQMRPHGGRGEARPATGSFVWA